MSTLARAGSLSRRFPHARDFSWAATAWKRGIASFNRLATSAGSAGRAGGDKFSSVSINFSTAVRAEYSPCTRSIARGHDLPADGQILDRFQNILHRGLQLARRIAEAGLAVDDEIAESADVGHDHRAGTGHRLGGRHAERFLLRGRDQASARAGHEADTAGPSCRTARAAASGNGSTMPAFFTSSQSWAFSSVGSLRRADDPIFDLRIPLVQIAADFDDTPANSCADRAVRPKARSAGGTLAIRARSPKFRRSGLGTTSTGQSMASPKSDFTKLRCAWLGVSNGRKPVPRKHA